VPDRNAVRRGGRSRRPAAPDGLDLNPDLAAWDSFVSDCTPGSYLQTSAWAEVKAPNGWTAVRFIGAGSGQRRPVHGPVPVSSMPADEEFEREVRAEASDAAEEAAHEPPAGAEAASRARSSTRPKARERGDGSRFGAQLLIRKPRIFPWAFAYCPRGPVLEIWDGPTLEAFTGNLRYVLSTLPARVSHVRIEPEIETDGPFDLDGELRHALRGLGWRAATPIQPPRTRQVDLRADEAVLWGDLRKKWRQYVSKARREGVRIVDAPKERLPEFYSIYQETARRAGFVIRTYESYVGVWEAFAKLGMARLLMAEDADGQPVAALFLLRVGDRVIEPYGGMTGAGADSRANYLLKWEAIRSSRELGAVSYDMWGLSHEGIEHFKTGFGGREIRYVGAWDLVIDPAGRLLFDSAQVAQDRIGAWRHGILKVRGRPHTPAGDPE
jgi:lipid II:glycine glycyltransferase (peptidoglycan interpeptide bridge formation enzyme)